MKTRRGAMRDDPDVTAISRDATDDLVVARRVLDGAGAGLRTLSGMLDERFVAALDVLGGVEGRVVVTGMGKSGHIARKIAATFASTGTPAQYVHPAEASHGDLGMITRADAVLALSNSGETPELANLIDYAKLCQVPLVAITGRRGSTLDKAADVALLIPDGVEACPFNLAPTTSTTVMMALGDALAVAMLERLGFSQEDFKVRHPGGQLGRRLIKLGDIMHRDDKMPLRDLGTGMADALIEMSSKSFGCVGVLDGDGRLVGIITDGDLRRHMNSALLAATVDQVMTRGPSMVGPDQLAAAALGLMNERTITSLFVVEDGRPVGIVHIHDCLRAGIA
jgi:arabinose-5-phosphate isomerase